MAKNPKWWKDTNDELGEGEKSSDTDAFDPSTFDGQQVTGSLTHEQLDSVIAHRQIDTTDLAPDANKDVKVEFINNAGILS